MAHVEDRWTIPNPNGRGRIKGPRYGRGSRWLAVWHERSGARRKKAFETKDAATAHLEKVGHEQRAGTYVSPSAQRVTFREVAERWFAAQLQLREGSREQMRARLDVTILPTLGGLRWDQVDRTVIQNAVVEWSSQWAASTTRTAYTVTAAICRLAVAERRVFATPCEEITLPSLPDDLIVPLTVAQVQALTDASVPWMRPMFVLAAASGLRSAELRGLTWDRITRTADGGGVVRVDRQLLKRSPTRHPEWGPPKTRHSVRNVSVGPATMEALGDPREGLVFRTKLGTAVSAEQAGVVWRSAAAKVDGVRPRSGWHELRHFHASMLIAGGSSPVAVAHRLGHKDATETLRTYSHLWPDDDARMRDAADGVITVGGSVGAARSNTPQQVA
ncbi:MAG: hypothetical protein BGO96_04490 [Micrococcales bacterium 73-15]|uniref:tyrosine-type recombinase/integrase n=1 Tax=Salana multivorans TaxID=120377 RepID=UPI00095C2754|nr:site-specific integrase [Salana multivorans]OJX98424.1 MAG: hypothetical protein BGO96_04490 [Micrococcales bacterium 73-15]